MANMNFGESFDTLANDEFWLDVAMLFVGYFGSVLAAVAFESIGPDLPNEMYGIGVIAVSETFSDYRMISAGGGLYTADVLAGRVGLKDQASALVEGGN